MKKINVLLPLLLLLSAMPVVAVSYSTDIWVNLTWNNETVKLDSEGLSITYNITNFTQTTNHLLNLTRENSSITFCDENLLEDILESNDEILSRIDSRDSYFESYVSCFGNLSVTSARLSACQEKPSFESEYNTCVLEKKNTESEKNSAQILVQQYSRDSEVYQLKLNDTNTALLSVAKENNTLSFQRYIFGLVGAIVMFILYGFVQKSRQQVKEPGEDILK